MSLFFFIMIAVVEIGGNQFTVEVGQVFDVDHQNVEAGAKMTLEALLVSDAEGKDVKIGTPFVSGSKITFEVVRHYRAEKIRVFKIKAKKRYMRTYGFRASRTELKVTGIA